MLRSDRYTHSHNAAPEKAATTNMQTAYIWFACWDCTQIQADIHVHVHMDSTWRDSADLFCVVIWPLYCLHCACLRNAGTDANVTIELYGYKGSVGSTKLDSHKNNFERGAKDVFKVCNTPYVSVKLNLHSHFMTYFIILYRPIAWYHIHGAGATPCEPAGYAVSCVLWSTGDSHSSVLERLAKCITCLCCGVCTGGVCTRYQCAHVCKGAFGSPGICFAGHGYQCG